MVPACLGAPILLALISGELGKLFEYDEEEQEEEDDEEEEKKDGPSMLAAQLNTLKLKEKTDNKQQQMPIVPTLNKLQSQPVKLPSSSGGLDQYINESG